MDVYIYSLDLTKEEPEIEITPGQAVKQFNIGNYVEYDIGCSFGPNDRKTIMYGFSNKEMNIPFFSTDKKCVLMVATDDSNELDDVQKMFRFCDEECTKLLKKAKQLNMGMEAANKYMQEVLHGYDES